MRLYLSSFRLGDHADKLVGLLDDADATSKRSVGVIANAMDALPADVRRASVDFEIEQLAGLGLAAEELDLRTYFSTAGSDGPDSDLLAGKLAGYRMLWVRGGNAFVLRSALAHSGADSLVTDLLSRDALVYAGYSAGSCVLAPSLRGIELVDPVDGVRRAYGTEPTWEGLGVLPYAVVPHYRSDHPESADIERVAELYRATGVPHRALRDGQAIVVEGDCEAIF